MAAPAVKRIKYTLGGSVHGVAWESAFYASYDGAIPVLPTDLSGYAAAVYSLLNATWLDEWKAINDPSTNISSLRTDLFAAGSLAVSQSATFTDVPGVGSGALGSAVSQAICTSLYSDTPSRSGRGRMYMPATALLAGAGTTSGFTVARVNSYLAAFAGALADINGFEGPDGSGTVRVGVQSITQGQIRPVTTVLCDTRPDRIEHREKQITWARSSQVVLTS